MAPHVFLVFCGMNTPSHPGAHQKPLFQVSELLAKETLWRTLADGKAYELEHELLPRFATRAEGGLLFYLVLFII